MTKSDARKIADAMVDIAFAVQHVVAQDPRAIDRAVTAMVEILEDAIPNWPGDDGN